jgi:hypothetical protein
VASPTDQQDETAGDDTQRQHDEQRQPEAAPGGAASSVAIGTGHALSSVGGVQT